MVDIPGRVPDAPSEQDDASANPGWGSPVPAEYGSLRAVGPPDGAAGRRRSVGRRVTDRDERTSAASMLRRLQGSSGNGSVRARTTDLVDQDAPDPAGSTDGPVVTTTRTRKVQPGFDRTTIGDEQEYDDDLLPGQGVDLKEGPTRKPPLITSVIQAPLPIGPRNGWLGINWRSEDRLPRVSRKERSANRKASTIRTKATIRHLDLLTVLRVSLIFYLIVLVIVVFASVMLWYAADAFGTLPSMEKSIRTLFDLKTFVIHPSVVAKYTAAGGAVLAVAGVFANMLGALIYNLISDLVGGFRVEMDSFPTE
jgi:hypothetical protein